MIIEEHRILINAKTPKPGGIANFLAHAICVTEALKCFFGKARAPKFAALANLVNEVCV